VRILIVGTARERGRVRQELLAAGLEVVGEFETLGEARNARVPNDAVVLARADPSDSRHPDGDPDPVTPREREVLELLVHGLSNRAIGARLGISDQTVKFHVAAICGKLGAANRTDAVRRAIRRGIVTI
jgi:DNA-binding NarL/FixJ family response regulator